MHRVQLAGFSMVLHGDNYLEQEIVKTGAWEPSTTRFFRDTLQPGQAVVDIGANVGYYSLLSAALVGPSGEVHAFEPYPGYVKRMQLNLDANDFSNIRLNQFALSDKRQRHTLFKGLASARMHRWKHENPVFNKVHDEVEVECIRFDDYAAENLTRLDLMKVDVDGYEINVLRGAVETIRKYRPVVMIEVYEEALRDAGGSSAELLRMFEEWGYQPYSEQGELFECEELVSRATAKPGISTNVVFRPAVEDRKVSSIRIGAENQLSTVVEDKAIAIGFATSKKRSETSLSSAQPKILFLAVNYEDWVAPTVFFEQQAIAREMPQSIFYGPGYNYNTNYVSDMAGETFGLNGPDAIFCYVNEKRLIGEPLCKDVVSRYKLPEDLHIFPRGLENVSVPKIAWINDFWHCSREQWDEILLGNGFETAFSTYCPPFVSREVFDAFFSREVQDAVRFIPWPRAINPEIFRDYKLPKHNDVTILGAMDESFYPLRTRMHREFLKQSDISYFHQAHPGYKFFSDKQVLTGRAYAKAINSSKIFASCTGKYKIPFIKLYEVMACNTVLMCDKPSGAEFLGLKEKENYIDITADNFLDTAKRYLSGRDELLRIAKSGRELFLAHHTVDIRAREFSKTISDILNGREPSGWAELYERSKKKVFVKDSRADRRQLVKTPENGIKHITEVSRDADRQTLEIWYKYGVNNHPDGNPPVVTEFPELVVLRGVYLRQLAEQIGAKYMAEVGTARGFQSFMWAQYLIDEGIEDGVVYTCDIEGMDAPVYRTPLTGDKVFTRRQLWADTKHAKYVRFTHGDSSKLAEAISHKIDLLYIDGQHTEQAVYSDFKNLFPFLKPGSFIVFDDCDERFEGIKKAVKRISNELATEPEVISFEPHKYKIAVLRVPAGCTVGENIDEFEFWFSKICIGPILERARNSTLVWEGQPLEWDACHEIMAYHEFCKGRISLERLLWLSNNRYQLLDEIWQGEPSNKQALDSFYEQSAAVLPWGHGVFVADHRVQERRSNWLRRVKILQQLKRLGVDSVLDYGAGGGHTTLLAKAMGFSRVVHYEYGVFNDYVRWRAGFINSEQNNLKSQSFDVMDANSPLDVSQPVDAVICTDVAEHVWDPIAMLGEIRSALRTGGFLVWCSCFGEGISCHLHRALKGKEEQILKQAGFQRVGDLPAPFQGHSGLYEAIPLEARTERDAKNLKDDSSKTQLPARDKSRVHEKISVPNSMEEALEQNQWLSPAELERFQWRDLKSLLEHSYRNVPFYRRRFDSVGLNLHDIRGMDDFRKIPILTKTDIQQNLEAMRANNCPADQIIRDATGGSTGQPLVFYRDLNAKAWIDAAALRFRRWMDYGPSSKLALIWGADRDVPDSYPANQRWLNSFNCSEDDIARFVDELVQWRPDTIRAYASSLYMVACYIRKKGLRAPRPKVIESAAEKLWDWQRKVVEEVFGCKVFEMYGSREIPSLACECECHNGMHIFSDLRLVEVIKDGRCAKPGEEGSIVVTDLVNYGMPLIRYEIGDIGVISQERCPCDRGFPLLEEIKGRITSTIQTPDGRLIHGEYFTHLFYNVPGVKAFQVHQTKLDEVMVLVQPDSGFDRNLAEQVTGKIRSHLGDTVAVRWKCVDEIPVTASGKRHFTISDIPADFAGIGDDNQEQTGGVSTAHNPAGKKILFIVDEPLWAHDFKTDNIMRRLGDTFNMRKRYRSAVTANDIGWTDLVILYYWREFSDPNMTELIDVFVQQRHKLLIGICSHQEMAGEHRQKILGFIRGLACGVFVNSMLLHKEFSPCFDIPVFYTPNGVDTEFFTPAPRRPTNRKLRVGWAGSILNHSGTRGYHDFIVPAVNSVDGIELAVAAREDKWRSLDEMLEFYRSVDVYICASAAEGTPNPCLEAAACGVPLLTTPVGNMPELVRNGVNGFFIERDVRDITDKLKLLRDNPQLRERLGRNMLESIRQWDWKVQAQNYRKMFESMLGTAGDTGTSPKLSVVHTAYNRTELSENSPAGFIEQADTHKNVAADMNMQAQKLRYEKIRNSNETMQSFPMQTVGSSEDNCEVVKYFLKAQEEFDKEKYEKAFKLYAKCFELDADNLTAVKGLFQASCQTGSFEKAIHYLKVYLDRHPGDTSVMFSLATLYIKCGRLDESKQMLINILALDAANEGAFSLLQDVENNMASASTVRF